MNQIEYFKKSKDLGLPSRCPILNYCQRRVTTIYCYADYSKLYPSYSVTAALQTEGHLPKDFDEKSIQIQGELPLWKKSDIHISYHNMCPEVNLFDYENSLSFAMGTASSGGEWDDYRDKDKFVNEESKHYSECPEFSTYIFKNKETGISKRISSENQKRRIGISQKLRFEIFQRDNFTCQYCGRSQKDKIKLEIDHKVPVSEGGADDFNNLITSCNDCNRGKSNKIIKGSS
jgi:5-methylcytosine-specific restriction endonuclease McrA